MRGGEGQVENLRDVKEIKKLLNKAYGKDSSPEDATMARLIAYSFYGKFAATHPNIVPRETMEKGDDNMEQRKFKVGDKVRVLYGGLDGMIGKIAFVRDEYAHVPYVVVFDENVDMLGQDVDAAKQAVQKGYDYRKCWIYDCDELELVEEEEMEPMFKLEMGKHVVETRNGSRYLLVKQEEDTIVGLNLDDWTAYVTLTLDENLHDVEDHEFDIKRVYEYRNCGFSGIKERLSDPVWERKETKEMTVSELEEALKLPKGTLRVKGDD